MAVNCTGPLPDAGHHAGRHGHAHDEALGHPGRQDDAALRRAEVVATARRATSMSRPSVTGLLPTPSRSVRCMAIDPGSGPNQARLVSAGSSWNRRAATRPSIRAAMVGASPSTARSPRPRCRRNSSTHQAHGTGVTPDEDDLGLGPLGQGHDCVRYFSGAPGPVLDGVLLIVGLRPPTGTVDGDRVATGRSYRAKPSPCWCDSLTTSWTVSATSAGSPPPSRRRRSSFHRVMFLCEPSPGPARGRELEQAAPRGQVDDAFRQDPCLFHGRGRTR